MRTPTVNETAARRRPLAGAALALIGTLAALSGAAPMRAGDQDSKEYGAIVVYQDPDFQTCKNEVWINGDSLSGVEAHLVDSYQWTPGNPTPSSTCLSRKPASGYPIQSLDDYTNTEQTGPYQHSCVCEAGGGSCLQINAKARNLSIYGVDFAMIKFSPWGCGQLTVNGRAGGYFYHKNKGCFEVSGEKVHVDSGQTIDDVAIPIQVVSRDCRDGSDKTRLWVYEAATKLIRVGEDQTWCLAKSGANQGDAIVIRKCDAVKDEYRQWNYQRGGDYSQIESTSQPGMCVDLIQNNMADGTKFQLYPCNQSDAQEWRLAW